MRGPDGKMWYSDFGELIVGSLDPKTGEVKDYPLPVMKEGWPKGTLALSLDSKGNFWIAGMYQVEWYAASASSSLRASRYWRSARQRLE